MFKSELKKTSASESIVNDVKKKGILKKRIKKENEEMEDEKKRSENENGSSFEE